MRERNAGCTLQSHDRSRCGRGMTDASFEQLVTLRERNVGYKLRSHERPRCGRGVTDASSIRTVVHVLEEASRMQGSHRVIRVVGVQALRSRSRVGKRVGDEMSRCARRIAGASFIRAIRYSSCRLRHLCPESGHCWPCMMGGTFSSTTKHDKVSSPSTAESEGLVCLYRSAN